MSNYYGGASRGAGGGYGMGRGRGGGGGGGSWGPPEGDGRSGFPMQQGPIPTPMMRG